VVIRSRSGLRRGRVGGWILVETLIAVAVLTLVLATAAPLIVTGIRGASSSIDALQHHLSVANATLAASRLLDDGASPVEIVAFLQERYPTVEVALTKEEIVIADERVWVGTRDLDGRQRELEWNR
jgi:type II secretory pathway pseudopilin PulG